MQRDLKAWLWDVQSAAADIQRFVIGLDLAAYASSELVHSAVERKFEIIGEALSQLAKASPETASRIPKLPRIIGFRNRLIHGYAQVNHATVWSAVHESLPALQYAVRALLTELGDGES
ncbi:MAG TPA: HepT-like ribonuclease domain-containing protein [Ramlibacter sp.]|uniref:HepT-like ribonuclease domain-containing protein n=1 Tax=Ramlibacter sp. TaxID=1917967 RepID=UPI002D15B7BB|nr:HepT-like ribonuclease domain-containing protein [Ramlibacter sp.]HVZ43181.1 HepT-like ribonuclease domain-containing protein [Ramlibacter sp.]